MTPSPATVSRTHEIVINVALARVLRERLGLTTAAEEMLGRSRLDVVLRRDGAPVVLEVEIEPAPTVDADALARLGLEIDGQPVQNTFAVTVPGQFRQTDQRHLEGRLAAARDLRWREWRIDGTSGPRLSGDVGQLGRAADRAVPPSGNLQEGRSRTGRGRAPGRGAALPLPGCAGTRSQDLRHTARRRDGAHGGAGDYQRHDLPGTAGRRRPADSGGEQGPGGRPLRPATAVGSMGRHPRHRLLPHFQHGPVRGERAVGGDGRGCPGRVRANGGTVAGDGHGGSSRPGGAHIQSAHRRAKAAGRLLHEHSGGDATRRAGADAGALAGDGLERRRAAPRVSGGGSGVRDGGRC